ncbi:pyridoxamine 5'-phosphate oxidase family protein [Arthrobacter sp. H35-D1]|uniref:pyridoxamine 5'-phosphate oxidase family protein n=1 Tax=Arthrobacter sp. H35-D1 TaxID=3046202 RepID=UPI0024B8B459|nr:pyridoxamine 5'-phosphate oxidase family protein [Arthrobacter sp. H35-D1]MDJ0313539.1 pyridoxamine 5'-phosphate oxidase family protein [Arthrobacter sp. H35-D1]
MRANAVAPKAVILTATECWTFLSQTSVGRLAVTVDGRPDVFPVNYQIDGESLLFRTGDGTKMNAINADGRVAFEVDAVNEKLGKAWSVVIKGHAEFASSEGHALNTTARGLFPWQGVGGAHLVRILPETMTGRRFALDTSVTSMVSLDEAIRAGLE